MRKLTLNEAVELKYMTPIKTQSNGNNIYISLGKTYTFNDLNWHIIVFLVIYFCSSITFTRQPALYVLTVEVSDSSNI